MFLRCPVVGSTPQFVPLVLLLIVALGCGDPGDGGDDNSPVGQDAVAVDAAELDSTGTTDTSDPLDAAAHADTAGPNGDAETGAASDPNDGAATDDGTTDAATEDSATNESCPGGPECACEANDDCDAGLCIEGLAGTQCARTCVAACGAGFACAQVPHGSDVVQVCVSKWARLCSPCKQTADCNHAGVTSARCLKSGTLGAFCGSGCSSDADCPSKHACKDAVDVDGNTTKQCRPTDTSGAIGECTCTANAVALAFKTGCSKSVAKGGKTLSCKGEAQCKDAGKPAACFAPDPVTEKCDGLDNDCDGQIDNAACDDGNPCTTDVCAPSTGCAHAPADMACDDGNACTTKDACSAGKCTGGAALQCDDGDVCTANFCDPPNGCTKTALTETAAAPAPCDDDDVCSTTDACSNGVCTPGAATSCDDDNPCTDDACDPKTGCTAKSNTLPCSDGSVCTLGDTCKAGACAPLSNLPCSDANPCTSDACEPKKGCVFAANTLECSDGNVCSIGDLCAGGVCLAGAVTACDDDEPCTLNACSAKTGCNNPPVSTSCSDGDVCSVGDSCQGGACKAGSAQSCDDGNPCTDDTCDPAKGCVHADNTAKCSDGNACTIGDVCAQGVCKPAHFSDCDDGNVCTAESCDTAAGCKSSAATAPCTDGSVCTVADTCKSGVCAAGATQLCGDGNPCTADSCDAKKGCVTLPLKASCTDANACTQNDACSAGHCKPGKSVVCDDSNVCTTDSCDPNKGCAYESNSAPCDDNSVCTVADTCKTGACQSGKVQPCGDGNPCTADSCHAQKGCVLLPLNTTCTDANACTVADTCKAGFCKPGAPPNCDDANVCTSDSCNAAIGCVHQSNSAPCDDNSACSVADVCQDKACKPGKSKLCSDGNPCTADSCDANKGCVFLPINSTCTDANACTVADTCQAGLCKPGAPLNCDDANVCTSDSCKFASGCVHVPNKLPCDDKSVCSVGDVCQHTVCKPGAAKPCGDGNSCTDDSCDAKKGCVSLSNAATCTDGNACTEDDVCKSSKCASGAAKVCNDANPCTTDSCDAAKGCRVVNNSAACSDGSVCTTDDVCSGGKCAATKSITCKDGKPCTDDTCDKVKGCQYLHNTADCDDGNPCTDKEKCKAGVCTAGVTKPCEHVKNPKFNSVSGQVCASGVYAGPLHMGGEWRAFVRDTHPGNGYGCGAMCAGSGGNMGYAGGSTGAGCNSWVYQCVQVPHYSNKITFSYRLKTATGYGGSVHAVFIRETCSNGPPSGGNDWTPYGGKTIYSNNTKAPGWTNFSANLTAKLAAYKGKTVFIGVLTNNSWAASYNPRTWVDDVSLFSN